jgi:hypothetical protein
VRDEPQIEPLRLVSLVVRRGARLALVIVGASWRETESYTLIPVAFPGDQHEPSATLADTLRRIACERLGGPARVVSSPHVYGPSPQHAIDRLADGESSPQPVPRPLLRLERGMPLEMPSSDAPAPGAFRLVRVCAYLADSPSSIDPPPGVGILWLTLGALRLALRGAAFADLLTSDAVIWLPGPDVSLPENAFLYVASEFGERHVLRIAAKYGSDRLFHQEDSP